MKKHTLILAAALSLGAIATAQKQPAQQGLRDSSGAMDGTIIPATVISTSTFNGVTQTTVSLAGEDSWDGPGDPDNVILSVDLGADAVVFGLGWDVSQETVGASWLSEANFLLDDSSTAGAGPEAFALAPSGTGSPGIESNTSPVILLADAGLPDLNLPSGTLLIELNESFDDVPDAVDCLWTAGELTIEHSEVASGVPTVGQRGLIILTALLFAGVVWRSVSTRETAPTVG